MTDPVSSPLWPLLHHAYFQGAADGARHGYAAQIEALADWLVPEQEGLILLPGEATQMKLRQRLLDAAAEARRWSNG